MRRSPPVRGAPIAAFGLLAALLLTAGPAHASALSAFHTPGWVVQCAVVGEEHAPILTCTTLASGEFVSMGIRSPVETGRDRKSKGHRDPFAASRLLGFGRYWKFESAFGCVNRASGLKCWNAAGHGWRIDRDGRRLLF